ncbi:MAG: autotransporter outer membrane beta-barrel domain-containing protein, partial [Deltaproteobacteria bacterium]
ELRYESFDVDDARRVQRNPGESGLDRFLTQTDGRDGESLRVRAHGQSRFLRGKVVATSGFSYVRLDTDVSGSRIYGDRFGASFDPAFANRQPFERGFLGLDGRNELRLRTGNLSVMAMARKDLRVVAALRASKESYDSQTSATETLLDPRVSPSAVENALLTDSSSNRTTFDESVEVRYTGLARAALYLTADWQQADGDLIEQQTTGGLVSLDRKTNVDRIAQRYALGGTWRPLRALSLSGKYGYARRKNDYDQLVDSTDNRLGGDRYPAFFVSDQIEDNALNVRLSWRPATALQIATRYDFDRSVLKSRGEGFASVEGGKVTSHSIGATASWKPIAQMYLQADGTYTQSQTDTPADTLSGTAGLLVPDFDNDFWNASVLSGVALDDDTDLRVRYYFYRADNYADNSAVSLPYGADAEEHGVSATLERRISEAASGRLLYGYVTSDDRTSGGHDDFSGHLVLMSVRLGF